VSERSIMLPALLLLSLAAFGLANPPGCECLGREHVTAIFAKGGWWTKFLDSQCALGEACLRLSRDHVSVHLSLCSWTTFTPDAIQFVGECVRACVRACVTLCVVAWVHACGMDALAKAWTFWNPSWQYSQVHGDRYTRGCVRCWRQTARTWLRNLLRCMVHSFCTMRETVSDLIAKTSYGQIWWG